MKNITKIFAGVVILASFASCSQKLGFEHYSYARLESVSYTFNEDAGTVSIPLYARTSEGTPASGTVTFEIVENTAKAGTHFNVSGNTATISNGTGAIVIDIVNLEGVFTSDVNFTINLTGASDGLTLGGIYTTRINIKDLDHPLATLLGDYAGSLVSDVWGDRWNINFTIEPIEGSTTEVKISNICPYAAYAGYPHKVIGVVNEEKTEIHIQTMQDIAYEQLFFVAIAPDQEQADELVIDVNANGTLSTSSAWGSFFAGEDWYDYDSYWDYIYPSSPVVWTKQ